MKTKNALRVVTVVLSISTNMVSATPVLINGGFETGDFTGWNVGIAPTVSDGGRPYSVDTAGDGWVVQNTANSLNPITGYSAFNGFDGGVVDSNGTALYEADLDFYLQQAFSFEGVVDSAVLSFSFDITGGPGFSVSRSGLPTEDRVFDVGILNSSETYLSSVYSYSVEGTTTDGNPLQTINLDITSFFEGNSGNSFILDFNANIPQYFTGGARFVIDDINLDIQTVPEPATMGLMAVFAGGVWFVRRFFPKV